MTARPLKILVSAGEASGDRLGAGLAHALRRMRPDVEIVGMGGSEMADAGVRLVAHAADVAVVGIAEVLAHLPAIRRARASLIDVVERERPDLFVPVDFPEFNLHLAGHAKAAGVPVVYFVSPQIWAWRRGRVRKIRDRVRRMLVLLPFEASFYEHAGVRVTFIGHPAVERSASRPPRAAILESLSIDPGRRVVALLPGSRVAEVKRLLPKMLGAARLLRAARPELTFVIPRAKTIPEGLIEGLIARSGLPDVRVLTEAYPDILTACDAGVVASGTATLDAALAELPMVAVYRVGWIASILAHLLVHVDRFSLPNLIADEKIIPELFGTDVDAKAIAAALGRFLDSPEETARVRAKLAAVRARLAGPGVYDRAATAVLGELDHELKPDMT